ncbi:MAG: carboxypeptidase regulatory-like domain-containing protein, partial [Myxococcales bacterium]|nr:carboxypeptidase regulatory-like domain-containing protein [Myxococcales bacterium]
TVLQDGAPVASARVILTSAASAAGATSPREVVTDDAGRFDFGLRRAASYDVTAAVVGAGEGAVRIDTRDPASHPASDALTLVLPGCAHAIVGTVRDAAGGVIVGAEVRRALGPRFDARPVGAGVRTDDAGAYVLCAAPGPITAVVAAQGYGSVSVTDTVFGRRHLDVDLVPEAIVVGRVVDGDGETGVGGVAVSVWPAAWPARRWPTPTSVISTSDGRFRIAGLDPGRHVLFARTGPQQSGNVPVVAVAGTETAEVVLRLGAPMVEVRGRVVEDGHAVVGATVIATRGEGAARRRLVGSPPTDEAGRFTLRISSASRLSFEVPGHDVTAPAWVDVPDDGRRGVVVDVRSRGVIRGTVIAGGHPIAGAEVSTPGVLLEGSVSTTSDAQGRYELRGLSAGDHPLYAQSFAARAFATERAVRTVRLADREVRDHVDLVLDGAASIRGTLVDQDGAPLPRLAVRYTDARTGDLCRAITDDDGEFVCDMMAGGGHYVPVVRPDDASTVVLPAVGDGLAAVELPNGASRVSGVRLQVRADRRRIAGRVVDQDGAPYPDVALRAIDASTGYGPDQLPWTGGDVAFSDGDGHFEVEVWGDTPYTVHARAAGGAEASVADVRGGADDVVIRIEAPGAIRGTLVGFAHRPDAWVRPLGNTIDVVPVRVDGETLAVDGLRAGRYAVFARSRDEAAAAEVEVVAGATTAFELRRPADAHYALRVVDFVSGAPVAGVACSVAPSISDLEGFNPGVAAATPTDADGRVELDGPSGAVLVGCQARPRGNSEGAARVVAAAATTVDVDIPVVTSRGPGNGLGVRLGLGVADPGYQHPVVELRPGGAGERAGLHVGDLVTAIDGRDVSTLTDLGVDQLVGSVEVGTTLALAVRRGGTTRIIGVLVEGPWWH